MLTVDVQKRLANGIDLLMKAICMFGTTELFELHKRQKAYGKVSLL